MQYKDPIHWSEQELKQWLAQLAVYGLPARYTLSDLMAMRTRLEPLQDTPAAKKGLVALFDLFSRLTDVDFDYLCRTAASRREADTMTRLLVGVLMEPPQRTARKPDLFERIFGF